LSERPSTDPRGIGVPAWLLLLLLSLIGWSFTFRFPLTGADVWPILAQAQAVLAEPRLLVSQRYLEGLWEGARFWRPGLTAYTALQYALFADRAMGYHVMRWVLLVGAAALAGTLAARRGAAPRASWSVAALVVALHPLQAETVPVTARDADTLATVLMLGALVALSGRDRLPAGRLGVGVLLALLAPTVKEPALLAPILAIAVLEPWRRRDGQRGSIVASAILVAGLVAQLLYRVALMGTIGRYERDLPIPLSETVRELAAGLFDHQRWGIAPLVAALLGVAWVGWRLARRSGAGQPVPSTWPPVCRACLLWTGVGLLSFLSAPVFRLRYGEGLLPPLAVLAGAGVGAALAAARGIRDESGRGGGRLAWATLGLLAAGLLLACVPGSPLLWNYPQWGIAGRAADVVLGTTAVAIEDALQSGGPVERRCGRFAVIAEPTGPHAARALIDPFPAQPAESTGRLAGRTANIAILAPYAVEAYLQLTRGWPVGTVQIADGPPLLGVKPEDFEACEREGSTALP